MTLLKLKIDKLRKYLSSINMEVDLLVIQSKEALKYMLSEIYSPPPEEVPVHRMVIDLNSNAVELYTALLEYHRVNEIYGDSGVEVFALSTSCEEVPLDVKCVDRGSADIKFKDKLKMYKRIGVDDVSLCEDVVCTDIRNAVKRIRRSKSEEEVEVIRKAAQITERIIESVAPRIDKGFSELRIASLLESFARELGVDGFSFNTIVAIGENTAKPHHIPSRKEFKGYEPILIDFGVRVSGYVSDVTRMLIPKNVDKKYRDLVQLIDSVKNDAIAVIKSGVQCKDVDSVARSKLRNLDLHRYFVHGLGHGVGVDVHEEPRLSPNSRDYLVEGDVITVEPGVYVYGRYGVRLEDMVYVTKNGFEVLTQGVKVIEL